MKNLLSETTLCISLDYIYISCKNDTRTLQCPMSYCNLYQNISLCWTLVFFYQGTLNEQLQMHSAECRYNCDILSGEGPYSCEVCSKVFSKKRSLIKHKHIHSGVRRYNCDVCNKVFKQQSHLTSHLRIHSGERPYTCEVCNKTFTVSSSLRRHQKIHSGERPYTCDVCNKTFRQKFKLIIHQRIHSG